MTAEAASGRASRYVRWCTSSLESTVPASSFVPPRSTPITQPAAMIGHHTRLMADPQAPPEYKLYRTRPRLLGRRDHGGSILDELREAPPGERRRKPITVGRVALTVQTVKQFLGIDIDHFFEVNFDNFPSLVDSMGGIDYTGGCVVSRINGGFKNGGFTLRLHRGTTHINGKQALALVRTRQNLCNPRENDLTRARRQQKVLSAMKSRVFSFGGFIPLPFISWNAPKTLKTDMRGPALLGYAIGTALSGSPPTRVLPVTPQPGGGTGLQISDAAKQAAVRRFENG